MKIVFFDGVCNLCNGFVDFLMRWDKKQVLLFSPLQGETAKTYLPAGHQKMESVVFFRDGKVFVKSDAVIRLGFELNVFFRVFGVFLILPAWLRDSVYDFVAKNRYSWFGTRNTCRLPSASERARFLD